VESEDESCESGITSNITGGWGEKRGGGAREREIFHLLYDQDREKTEYSVFRNRYDERFHQNLMPRHLLDEEDQFLIFSGMKKIQLKSASNAAKGDHKVLIFMINCPVTPYDTLGVTLKLHMTLCTIYLKIKIQ